MKRKRSDAIFQKISLNLLAKSNAMEDWSTRDIIVSCMETPKERRSFFEDMMRLNRVKKGSTSAAIPASLLESVTDLFGADLQAIIQEESSASLKQQQFGGSLDCSRPGDLSDPGFAIDIQQGEEKDYYQTTTKNTHKTKSPSGRKSLGSGFSPTRSPRHKRLFGYFVASKGSKLNVRRTFRASGAVKEVQSLHLDGTPSSPMHVMDNTYKPPTIPAVS